MEEERRDAFSSGLDKIGGCMTWENKLENENFQGRLEEVFLFIKKNPGLFFRDIKSATKIESPILRALLVNLVSCGMVKVKKKLNERYRSPVNIYFANNIYFAKRKKKQMASPKPSNRVKQPDRFITEEDKQWMEFYRLPREERRLRRMLNEDAK